MYVLTNRAVDVLVGCCYASVRLRSCIKLSVSSCLCLPYFFERRSSACCVSTAWWNTSVSMEAGTVNIRLPQVWCCVTWPSLSAAVDGCLPAEQKCRFEPRMDRLLHRVKCCGRALKCASNRQHNVQKAISHQRPNTLNLKFWRDSASHTVCGSCISTNAVNSRRLVVGRG